MHGLTKGDHARRLLDNLSAAVLALDTGLRVRYMNPAAEVLFAISSRQARKLRFQDLVDQTNGVINGMRRCLTTGRAFTERQLYIGFAGQHGVTVDCSVTPLLERDQVVELLVELRQIDNLMRITREEHLIAQHSEARLLICNLAHEIKNPLGGLRGAAQLLEGEFTDDSLKEYTRIIIYEADRLRNLVDRMLGPVQLPAYEDINIHEVLERVVGLVGAESGSGICIERDYDPSIPALIGDFDQLVQAILNIVGNAVQATDGQGTIIVRTRIKRQFTIGQKRHKLVLRIDIIDDGPGIPHDIREKIFYPTISGRADGRGLGLSIAQNLISQHGGLIECYSRPGETMFTLLLPLERVNG